MLIDETTTLGNRRISVRPTESIPIHYRRLCAKKMLDFHTRYPWGKRVLLYNFPSTEFIHMYACMLESVLPLHAEANNSFMLYLNHARDHKPLRIHA